MIRAKGLSKTYVTEVGAVQAVRGVDMEVAEGEIFTLLGPSGCGKTTVLRCIAGLERPDEGGIVLGGHIVFADCGNTMVPAHTRGVRDGISVVCDLAPHDRVPKHRPPACRWKLQGAEIRGETEGTQGLRPGADGRV